MRNHHFVPAAQVPHTVRAAHWFIFRDTRLLVLVGSGSVTVPFILEPVALGLTTVRSQFVGYLDGVPCFSAEIAPDTPPPPDMQFQGLRTLYPLLDEAIFWVAARAVQIVDWDRTHQFCGQCGTPTTTKVDEHVKICPNCALTNYPRLAPAIIVAVERGDRLLLASNARFPRGFYSVLAGFVEAGESLEQTVAREIMEEVGISVSDIRYFGSQPWPFPHSLMIAFQAQYAGGDLVLQKSEIRDADWFSADKLPQLPPPLSIARQLIDDFVRRHSG
ncbi:MAG: NAD(+) diphosphatase [Anaerolineae bacterium]|nr:NAD(+) diphosphatase [Anaerolineae bacterium]